ncbi:alpha/beta hydrolase [Pseudomonas sp. PS1]|uniref:Alpha/beta hydrolase n=1 Tax=Stutzerimonas marianensis TaxID=2929513 RepID=A0A9X1W596_9GAMM|nr:alpha/beta hydrolase [Pseudomonas marianensis]MCJ0973607.1 alpha/beta hydrolase [Pseudomonas marianensis]
MNRRVVFIHDAWLTTASWDRFKSRFTACGYNCIALPWPPQEDGSARSFGLGLSRLVEHYTTIISGMPQVPLLVGHGFGGLIVQLLIDRGYGRAGIAIAPVPPRGIRPWLLAFDLLPVLFRAGLHRQVDLSFERFARKVAQTVPDSDRLMEFQRHVVKAPARIFYEAALGIDSKVDFANDHRPPLLLLAGANDRSIRASLVASNYRHHHRSIAPIAYKCFAGHSHWLIAESNWEEVADYSIEWAQTQSGRF